MNWRLLVLSLPTRNATARMRAWRALKASGAAVLRDGVYLLPESDAHATLFRKVADEIRGSGGEAWVVDAGDDTGFPALFDRSTNYQRLLREISVALRQRSERNPARALSSVRKLRRAYELLRQTDFFPGEPQRQAEAALQELEAKVRRLTAPDEPGPAAGAVPRLSILDFRGRLWATRARPWVDRLACAWLIQRRIDPKARFLWLRKPEDCPKRAIGFDFDGARFSHVGAKVSFETLLAAFGLDDPALERIGVLVHYLDVGGIEPPEAAGIQQVLAGMRDAIADDDQLLRAASGVFDGLLRAYTTAPGE